MSTHFAIRQEQQDDNWSDFKLWYYKPSVPAAVIFAVIFIALTAHHSYLLVRRRTWFCIPFVVGGILECMGYVLRILARSRLESVTIYAVQNLSLLLAPVLFAASVYMVLGRIIRRVDGEKYTLIRVNWLTKIFVGGDIFCFGLNGAGGGLLSVAKTREAIDTGNNIILGGLILQVAIFLVFVAVAIVFQRRLSQQPTDASVNGPLGMCSGVGTVGNRVIGRSMPGWKRLLIGLYATSLLITVRNVFRAIEYGMGWGSYLLVNEWTLYVFDAMLMVGVLIICILWYAPEISNTKTVKGMSGDEMIRLEGGEREESTRTRTKTGPTIQPWS